MQLEKHKYMMQILSSDNDLVKTAQQGFITLEFATKTKVAVVVPCSTKSGWLLSNAQKDIGVKSLPKV